MDHDETNQAYLSVICSMSEYNLMQILDLVSLMFISAVVGGLMVIKKRNCRALA